MIKRLKSRKKIETLFQKGYIIKESGLFFKGYDFNSGETRFGVSVSKKNFASAVTRNLIKRRIREQIMSSGLLLAIPKGVSFFVIYSSPEIISSKKIQEKLQAIAKKI